MLYKIFYDFILIIVKTQNEYENPLITSGRFDYHQRLRDENGNNPQSFVTVEYETKRNELPSLNQKSRISSSKSVCQQSYVLSQARINTNNGKFCYNLFRLFVEKHVSNFQKMLHINRPRLAKRTTQR